VMVGVIENSTKHLIHAVGIPNNAGMNLAHRLEKHLVTSLRHNREGRAERGI